MITIGSISVAVPHVRSAAAMCTRHLPAQKLPMVLQGPEDVNFLQKLKTTADVPVVFVARKQMQNEPYM